jgi:hypothetical protein
MAVDYIPLGFNKVDDFFKNTGYEDKIDQEEILLDLVDNRFCKYLYKHGKNAGLLCGRKSKVIIKDNCCKQHLKDLYPDFYKEYKEKNVKTYYIKKDKNNIYYCNSINIKNRQCNRKVKRLGELCYAHKHQIVKINEIILIFLELTIYIFIAYTIFILISYIFQNQKKQIICFGSLKFNTEIPNEKIISSSTYRKNTRKKFMLSQPLTFENKILDKLNEIDSNNNNNHIKIGEIKINTSKKINKQIIILKIKTLIFFKNLYLNVKNKNNNIIYNEPGEYFIENINYQRHQTARTSSYLFDDINYINNMYISFNFFIKSFKNKYGPPPSDASYMINYILNLLKYPDFNIPKINNLKNDNTHLKTW